MVSSRIEKKGVVDEEIVHAAVKKQAEAIVGRYLLGYEVPCRWFEVAGVPCSYSVRLGTRPAQ